MRSTTEQKGCGGALVGERKRFLAIDAYSRRLKSQTFSILKLICFYHF